MASNLVLIVFNIADGTAGGIITIYVNGTEETSFATDDTANVAQNEDSEMNLSSRVIRLGYGNEDDYAFEIGKSIELIKFISRVFNISTMLNPPPNK